MGRRSLLRSQARERAASDGGDSGPSADESVGAAGQPAGEWASWQTDGLRPSDRVTFFGPAATEEVWVGQVVSVSPESFVVDLIDAEAASAVPEELEAASTTTGGLVTFATQVARRTGRSLTCLTPAEVSRSNRRTLFRIPVALPVDVVTDRDEGLPVRTTTLDIGHGGIRALLPLPVEEGTPASLSIQLSEDEAICPAATVRYCVAKVGGYSTGVAFEEISGADSRSLAKAIGTHQRRLLPLVHASLLVQWSPAGRPTSRSATTAEISPGVIVLLTEDDLPLGERIDLSAKIAGKGFALEATVVDCYRVRPRYQVSVALDPLDHGDEHELRSALHDLTDENES